ncbi:hypothetical protein DFH07DRAFT_767521 [Mycena maculata]|uniref:Uncharacterized protein n=1 Tax=Mycena maculata TaxID=230809 RepID=A0AAD7JWV1_9AGAR|nr:hypothetical protein DFH07DRAFT_767521 [Mycena maculata]
MVAMDIHMPRICTCQRDPKSRHKKSVLGAKSDHPQAQENGAPPTRTATNASLAGTQNRRPGRLEGWKGAGNAFRRLNARTRRSPQICVLGRIGRETVAQGAKDSCLRARRGWTGAVEARTERKAALRAGNEDSEPMPPRHPDHIEVGYFAPDSEDLATYTKLGLGRDLKVLPHILFFADDQLLISLVNLYFANANYFLPVLLCPQSEAGLNQDQPQFRNDPTSRLCHFSKSTIYVGKELEKRAFWRVTPLSLSASLLTSCAGQDAPILGHLPEL